MKLFWAIVLGVLLLLTGCTSRVHMDSATQKEVADPAEFFLQVFTAEVARLGFPSFLSLEVDRQITSDEVAVKVYVRRGQTLLFEGTEHLMQGQSSDMVRMLARALARLAYQGSCAQVPCAQGVVPMAGGII